MKEAILEIMELEGNKEIIKTQEMTIYYDKSDCAKEIAELMTAFIRWLIDEQEIFFGDLSDRYITKDNIVVNGKESLTIDELFTYWKDNVYEK